MQLTCNKCNHRWEEEVAPSQPVVMCPECLAIVPFVLAQKGGAPPSAKPAPPSSAPGDVKDIHDLKTLKMPASAPPEKPTPPRRPAQVSPPAPPGDIHDEPTMRMPSTPTPEKAPPEEIRPVPKAKPPSRDDPQPPAMVGETTPARPRTPSPPPYPSPGIEPASQKSRITPLPSAAFEQAEIQQLIGTHIDGYRIEQLIGKGGMGAVFLAHQFSLDRKVALKILPSRFSQDPDLIARFTREALSAAQLNHHNIIQVYDVGSQGDTHFISMEYVRGKNLGDMIRQEGRLRVDDAAAYILQAARGLRYAHECGIIHRDIKPDNLMLNEHGIIKIADMGLAKWLKDFESPTPPTPESQTLLQKHARTDLTVADAAMGTPAYMAPEQGQDAASVDERADQYSLGCTLYYLCAGKAPYSGTTAFELLSKHLREPLTPLEVHIQAVPPAFSQIVRQMLEKRPEDRYLNMDGVITDLEAYLGVESEKGPYTPREYHLALLEQKQKEYYAAPSIKRRKLAQLGFAAFIALCFLLSFFGGDFALAGGFLGLMVFAPVAIFVLNGVITKEYLFRRVRSVFFGMELKSWLALIGCSILALAALHLLGWLYFWLWFVFIAAGIAAAYQMLILKRLRAERLGSISVVQDMLKQLRVRGVSEDALHDFICRFSGVHWEEFFEELFGYEEMIIARGRWAAADKVKPRKKFALWREPLARWLENLEQARKFAREKRELAKTESRRLKARGVSDKEAQIKAELEATRFIETEIKKVAPRAKPARKIIRLRWKYSTIADVALRVACSLGGLMFTVAALADVLPKHGITTLGAVLRYVPAKYYTQWGWGGTEIAAAAGFLLFLMTFASRPALRILVWLGVIALTLKTPILHLVNQPQLTEQRIFFGGIALVLIGFGASLIYSINGKKF